MSDSASIKEELRYLENFQQIIETYQEIAASRMQRVKDSVLHNREYLDETRAIYHDVLNSYDTYIKQLLKNKKEGADFRKNGKNVAILLSANTKLYGPILQGVFDDFVKFIDGKDLDIVIVGKAGQQMFADSGIKREYRFFEIPDDIITPEALSDIIGHIRPYSAITVYHGQFVDILTQVAKKTAISPGISAEVTTTSDKAKTAYIFEPSINDVLLYFEKEILGSLFVQTVNESNLSKFTSRMIALNTTSDNVRKKLSTSKLAMSIQQHRISNKKQQDQLASSIIWM